MLLVGFGEIGGGVTFDLMERDLFGGNAGGRLELFATSVTDGVIVMKVLKRNIKNTRKHIVHFVKHKKMREKLMSNHIL